jgi:hypothetical protein
MLLKDYLFYALLVPAMSGAAYYGKMMYDLHSELK